ncbi:Hpt domain-containing protein [Thalassomonas sp. M1454]|uniref:Hpt domain-containing protein n=1 Tax=Thalassomonas sp. M1454 TaxID=2594477 RepID=UPI0011808ECB|nr:Hpt domain-containing protein [Thalassomonas sp. M1454]TRX57886.1 Hpt domain-containing protein [Thalassomonas sp. M1454]
MNGVNFAVKTPTSILGKGVLYVALLIASMLLLVGTSLWLYNQQASKADFLHQQQIPFIKNNAQLMKSVAELENQLVAQQLAIRHQELDQPLEDVKQAWLEIADLSKQHVLMVNDNLRDNTADNIAITAQTFASGYKRFVELVDDLLLIRQSRNGQYKANVATLNDIIKSVNTIRRKKQNDLNKHSYQFVNRQNVVKTETINSMMTTMNEAQFYQYLYQELLKVQNQLTALSSSVSAHQFNQISTQIANLTQNINKELAKKSEDDQLHSLTKEIETITSQLMGAGQLFAKWRDENNTSKKVIEQLNSYQDFLVETAALIEQPNFYDLPEFELALPFIGYKVKESTILPIGFLFIVALMFTSGFLAWRLIILVNRSYHAGADFIMLENEKEARAEKALLNAQEKQKSQMESIIAAPTHSELKQTEQQQIASVGEETEEMQPSFYKINNLVIDLDKFNQYHGSAEMAVFMLEDYLNRNKQNFAKLKEALTAENLAKVKDINAALLKTANILSAPRLIKVCEQLQQVCVEGDIHKAVPLLAEMQNAITEIAKYVEES